MAFPAIVGAAVESSTNTAGTSHTVNLPSLAAGNLALLIGDIGSTAATLDALAGWTELLDENLGNGIKVLYRLCDGTEGASITLTSSASTRSAWIAYEISGAIDPATQAPQLSSVGTGTSTTPDPPSLSPTGGAKDYLWFAFFGCAGEEADDDTWCNTSPTNYTPSPPDQKACGTSGISLGGILAVASRQANTATENPGTFGQDAALSWRAYTLAIHPAPAAVIKPQATILTNAVQRASIH